MFKGPPEARGQSRVKPDNPMSRVQPAALAPPEQRPAFRMFRDLVAARALLARRLVSPMFKARVGVLGQRAPRPVSPMSRAQPESRVRQAAPTGFPAYRVAPGTTGI